MIASLPFSARERTIPNASLGALRLFSVFHTGVDGIISHIKDLRFFDGQTRGGFKLFLPTFPLFLFDECACCVERSEASRVRIGVKTLEYTLQRGRDIDGYLPLKRHSSIHNREGRETLTRNKETYK